MQDDDGGDGGGGGGGGGEPDNLHSGQIPFTGHPRTQLHVFHTQSLSVLALLTCSPSIEVA